MRSRLETVASVLIAVAVAASTACEAAHAYVPAPRDDWRPWFEVGHPLPRADRVEEAPAWLAGSPIAAHGAGALAIDDDSGRLIRTDRQLRATASLAIGRGASQLVVDPVAGRAFVVDRAGDRVVVIDVRDAALAAIDAFPTPAEPFGIALTPDRATLLVTSIADRMVVAFDARTGDRRWLETVGPEPRGVAISPDGRRAVVTHLTTGEVEMIDLRGRRRVQKRALSTEIAGRCFATHSVCPERGAPTFARGAFAATFIGNSRAVVAYQRVTPSARRPSQPRQYGGASIPITWHLGFLGVTGATGVAQIRQAEPRAVAWDPREDALIVAGLGDDVVQEIARVSDRAPRYGSFARLSEDGQPRCGPTGLAITPDSSILVWCSATRSVVRLARRVELAAHGTAHDLLLDRGPELAATRFAPVELRGRHLFEHASRQVADNARVACGTCHLDGRSDGLSWRIGERALQTPVLAGRVDDTAPYRWDGAQPELEEAIRSSIQRLGGHGQFSDSTAPRDLAAYLRTLPPVRAPRLDAAAVGRGKALFASSELGCATCHTGPALTDGRVHAFASSPFEIDTPSLRGLAASAPYLHDGSAATLEDLLAGRGSAHGMIPRPLTVEERQALSAFLRSL